MSCLMLSFLMSLCYSWVGVGVVVDMIVCSELVL